jgi:hypothetical protein
VPKRTRRRWKHDLEPKVEREMGLKRHGKHRPRKD